MPLSRERIGCLDGLRAFSIALVILGHLAGTRGFPLKENVFSASLALLGVRVFFVISGFLITQILLDELAHDGALKLGRFYFRRTLRIFVPYYAFLLTIVALERAGIVLLGPGDFASAATYTSNYNPRAAWQVAHTWSLSVEEQFYLLWPAALTMLGRRRSLVLAALVVVAAPLARLGLWELAPMLREGIGHRFETCADSLAMGCLLAGLRGWLREHHGYYAAVRSRLSLIVGAMVLGAVVLDDHPRAAFAVGWSFQNMGIAFFIDACLHRKDGLLVRTLMSQPLTIVGRMSYSIYLWQQIFLDRQSAALMCRFPLNVFVVGVTAVVSYYGIESTSLALRHFVEPFLFRVRSRTPMVASAEPVAIVASAPHP